MNLRALKSFIAVSRLGSIRKAAEQLHIDATAISRHIQALEHYFGAELLKRTARGVTVTNAGELLAHRANVAVRDLDEIKLLIGDLKGLESGSVSIFAAEAVMEPLLSPPLATFSRQYPRINISIVASGADRTHEALRNGEADLGLTFYAPRKPDIVRLAHRDLAHVVGVHPDHPIAAMQSCTLADLLPYRVALPDSSFGARQAFDLALKASRLKLSAAFTVNSLAMLKGLAERGAALIILPLVCALDEARDGKLACIPIRDPRLSIVGLDLVISRDRAPSFAGRRCADMIASELELSPKPSMPGRRTR
jgi:DNA-binding transcriptional LysR family regulator